MARWKDDPINSLGPRFNQHIAKDEGLKNVENVFAVSQHSVKHAVVHGIMLRQPLPALQNVRRDVDILAQFLQRVPAKKRNTFFFLFTSFGSSMLAMASTQATMPPSAAARRLHLRALRLQPCGEEGGAPRAAAPFFDNTQVRLGVTCRSRFKKLPLTLAAPSARR